MSKKKQRIKFNSINYIIVNPIIALSSCWLSHRHSDGYEMLKEIASLGFEYAELSHGISASLVPGIAKAVQENVIKISSLHNFCPLPNGLTRPAPDLYEPSSKKQTQTDAWFRNTLVTIDFANKLNAHAVVMHLGSMSFFLFDPTKKITQYVKPTSVESLQTDPTFQNILNNTFFKLKKKSIPFIQRIQSNINRIIPHAQKQGVKLCFENREDIHELPLDCQFLSLLNPFSNSQATGYWHDTGHAQVKEEMGIITQEQLLSQNKKHLIGFHLQNVIDGKPHRPLRQGSVDFDIIKKFFEPHHIFCLELSPRCTTEEVLDSKDYLLELTTVD